MSTYYEILGVKQGAAQTEIKKAYFSLVRQHSPEKDPEKFREIREAYEHLKDAPEDQGPVFALPKDPGAAKFLEQIQIYQRAGDDERFRDACEEAYRIFPEEIQFLYLMTYARRRAGNTGKAVKSGEELVAKEPDNKWFWQELAFSYQERGYTRKAFGAFDRAYELGCRDNDFVLEFSLSCSSYEQYDRGIHVLTEFIGSGKRWKREEIPQVLEGFSGLMAMIMFTDGDLSAVLKLFKAFLEQYSIYVEENMDILSQIVTVMILHPALNDRQNHPMIQEIIELFSAASHSEFGKNLAEELEGRRRDNLFREDSRLSEIMRICSDIYFMVDDMPSDIRTFEELDMKLCMIEERQDILPQLDIVEAEYPEYFKRLEDFARRLREGKNLEYLKDSLLKQYCRLEPYIGGGMYFERYPQERTRIEGTVVYEDDTPYVRKEKKIGRNAPCPCGSGKKYKHCCMKKKEGN